jgi:hypothetical protein
MYENLGKRHIFHLCLPTNANCCLYELHALYMYSLFTKEDFDWKRSNKKNYQLLRIFVFSLSPAKKITELPG